MKQPVLKRLGVIRRGDFAAYLAALGPHLGFQIESPSFNAARDTGNGLHIRRRQEKLIELELELQHQWCRGFYCVIATDDDGRSYAGLTETATYEVGSVVTTYTQPEPGPHYQQPGEADHTCEPYEVDVNDTAEGAPEDNLPPEYFDELSLSSLLTGAAAGVADDGSPAVAQTHTWYPSAAAPTTIEQALGYWTDENATASTRTVHRYLYRWRLVTGYRLRIEWDQGGNSHALTLNPGETSSWYDDTVPVTEEVTDMIENVVISVL